MPPGDRRDVAADQSRGSRTHILERLFRSEGPGLARFVRSRIGKEEEVHDLVQEAFLRLAAARPNVLLERPEAYLQRIARNLVFNRYRRVDPLRCPMHVAIDEAESVTVPPEQEWAIEANDARSRYIAVLDTLTPRTREIFLLNRVEGLSYADIAARLDLTVKAIEYHMSRALTQLHQAFYGR
ncbi:sigma-70 family RNA polymerase sigma factor [Sphingobium sp. AN558]|uniref:RNA polymerase sigma factor n=1 Tax=Sphingobium sp. AN558 TaxID=3133442 RepID=UPI0030C121B2